jgi:hypothetical protein
MEGRPLSAPPASPSGLHFHLFIGMGAKSDIAQFLTGWKPSRQLALRPSAVTPASWNSPQSPEIKGGRTAWPQGLRQTRPVHEPPRFTESVFNFTFNGSALDRGLPHPQPLHELPERGPVPLPGRTPRLSRCRALARAHQPLVTSSKSSTSARATSGTGGEQLQAQEHQPHALPSASTTGPGLRLTGKPVLARRRTVQALRVQARVEPLPELEGHPPR